MAIEDSENFSVFLYRGSYNMDMFVLGIVVAHNYIGLISKAHIFHVLLGDFIKGPIVHMFATWKVQTYMGIPVLGSVALSLKIQHAPEEFWRYALGKRIAVAKNLHTFLSEDIVQCSGTGLAVNNLCYHADNFSIVIFKSA